MSIDVAVAVAALAAVVTSLSSPFVFFAYLWNFSGNFLHLVKI